MDMFGLFLPKSSSTRRVGPQLSKQQLKKIKAAQKERAKAQHAKKRRTSKTKSKQPAPAETKTPAPAETKTKSSRQESLRLHQVLSFLALIPATAASCTTLEGRDAARKALREFMFPGIAQNSSALNFVAQTRNLLADKIQDLLLILEGTGSISREDITQVLISLISSPVRSLREMLQNVRNKTLSLKRAREIEEYAQNMSQFLSQGGHFFVENATMASTLIATRLLRSTPAEPATAAFDLQLIPFVNTTDGAFEIQTNKVSEGATRLIALLLMSLCPPTSDGDETAASESSSGLSSAAIGGISGGSVAFAAILFSLVCYLYKRDAGGAGDAGAGAGDAGGANADAAGDAGGGAGDAGGANADAGDAGGADAVMEPPSEKEKEEKEKEEKEKKQ